MKHFCAKCGRPTIYALELPKFCSQCGSEFSAATKAKSDDDFSVVTKQKDKSVHDQALEKAKEKYPRHITETLPVTKAEPKNYPNPARASFSYKLVDDEETTVQSDDDYDDGHDGTMEDIAYEDNVRINASTFKKIKPKFTLQSVRASSESFENIVSQGYASNYQPMDISEMRNLSGGATQSNPKSVLEDFRREAGSLRSNQD
jgi:hypothetical protein